MKKKKEKKEHYFARLNEKIQIIVDGMTYLDDAFFTACMQNNPKAALVLLRIILGKPDLVFADKSGTQLELRNLGRRSIRLDLFCHSENRYYNVEVQRKRDGAGPHRARYHLSIIDANLSFPGEDFEELPDVCFIFITEDDYFGQGKAIYRINRVNRTTGEDFPDGQQILYVNSEYKGDDDLGKLMHDMRCVNPEDMYFEELRKPAMFFKRTKKGRRKLTAEAEKILDGLAHEYAEDLAQDMADEIADEKLKNNNRKIAANFIQSTDLSDAAIAAGCGLEEGEVKELRMAESRKS